VTSGHRVRRSIDQLSAFTSGSRAAMASMSLAARAQPPCRMSRESFLIECGLIPSLHHPAVAVGGPADAGPLTRAERLLTGAEHVPFYRCASLVNSRSNCRSASFIVQM
jgi:hypothetical protein